MSAIKKPVISKQYDTSGHLVHALSKNYASLYALDANWKAYKEVFSDWRGNSLWMFKNDHDECILFITDSEDNFPLGRVGRDYLTEKDTHRLVDKIIFNSGLGEENAKKFPMLAMLYYCEYVYADFSILARKCKTDLDVLFDLFNDTINVLVSERKHEYKNILDISNDKLEIVKILAFCEKTAYYFVGSTNLVKNLCNKLTPISPKFFEKFGITDSRIEAILEEKGISLGYFLSRKDSESPVAAYYIDTGSIKSYLSKDDELYCWRNHTEFMKKQWDYVGSEI